MTVSGVLISWDASAQNAVGNTSAARTLTVLATDGQSYLIPCTNTNYTAEDFVR